MITVRACIQQIPQELPSPVPLEMREIEASAPTYLEAVDRVEGEVPEGWRILYVSPADADGINNDRVPGESSEADSRVPGSGDAAAETS